MNPTERKTVTKATQAAKDVAAVLKQAFPGTGFSVRHYLIRRVCVLVISWEDGPSEDDVRHQVEAMPAVRKQFTSVYYNR
jgi:hypothetical protein